MCFLNLPFRFRPPKASSHLKTHLTCILLLATFPNFTTNSHDSQIKQKQEIGVRVSAFFTYSAYITSLCLLRSVRVNVNNSQGHGPPKTSDINFQLYLTPHTTSNRNRNTFDLTQLVDILSLLPPLRSFVSIFDVKIPTKK